MTTTHHLELDDAELGQAAKALGIRLDSLTSKLRRVSGEHRHTAEGEYRDCRSALHKMHAAIDRQVLKAS